MPPLEGKPKPNGSDLHPKNTTNISKSKQKLTRTITDFKLDNGTYITSKTYLKLAFTARMKHEKITDPKQMRAEYKKDLKKIRKLKGDVYKLYRPSRFRKAVNITAKKYNIKGNKLPSHRKNARKKNLQISKKPKADDFPLGNGKSVKSTDYYDAAFDIRMKVEKITKPSDIEKERKNDLETINKKHNGNVYGLYPIAKYGVEVASKIITNQMKDYFNTKQPEAVQKASQVINTKELDNNKKLNTNKRLSNQKDIKI